MGKNYDYCNIILIWTPVNMSLYTVTTLHLNKYKIYCVIASSFHSLFSFILPKGRKQRTINQLLSTHLLFLLSSQPQTYGTLLIIDSRIWACPIAIIFFYWICIKTYTVLHYGQLSLYNKLTCTCLFLHIVYNLPNRPVTNKSPYRKLTSTCPQPDLSPIDKVQNRTKPFLLYDYYYYVISPSFSDLKNKSRSRVIKQERNIRSISKLFKTHNNLGFLFKG